METQDPLSKYEAYRALAERLKSEEANSPPDPYWLASHINPYQIKLTAARPDYTNLSLPGCIYDALYEASIKLSADAKTIGLAKRLSDLARFFAALTSDQMTLPEQNYLTQKAENNIAPYAKEQIAITDEIEEDLHWINRRFGPDIKLKFLPPGRKKLPMPE